MQKLNFKIAQIIILIGCGLVSSNSVAQIQISKYLIGQNAWGRGDIFKVTADIKAVQYQTIRIGGNGYENGNFINKDVVRYIDYAREVGAEPIVQMPRQLKDNDGALKAIKYLNGELGKNIKFWSIGNEPDHHNQLASPEEVFDYFTKIAAQIKSYDPTAKIMGFDLSSYKESYLTRLLGGDLDVTKKVPNQKYHYLDIVAFHNYRFKDISGFEKDVKSLKQRLALLNATRDKNNHIGWAITEFNSHWIVDERLGEDFLPYNFHNGQIFAEMYDLGMREGAFTICPWSILEGGADREGTDLSMFDLKNGKFIPRSNYYHTQMLSQNLKQHYLSYSNGQADLKVIPMGDKTGVAVMVLNKSKIKNFSYVLNLDSKMNQSDPNRLSIVVDAGKKASVKSEIKPSSTQMFVFSGKGKLLKTYTYSISDEEAQKAPKITFF
ncbi:glycoside hydrolase family protein [Pedobacter jejuensis]|uniref:Glycoside hydrolase family 44 catalytic domain-containing protein n=1 Tax=Pedobacter jejuensis TaxID=1268550 RepID=A0A3N0C0U6_9SPHI|nr:glycoside hydrolase family 44 protein [Pedobacter jejuensis]RNL55889.1 hypothetical protein D7004_03810 [Pedobacter jejuensis]